MFQNVTLSDVCPKQLATQVTGLKHRDSRLRHIRTKQSKNITHTLAISKQPNVAENSVSIFGGSVAASNYGDDRKLIRFSIFNKEAITLLSCANLIAQNCFINFLLSAVFTALFM